ncbi:MAG: type III pantothenate kinase, partial [Pseudomonadota bacterium]|nr:type III pantothenate kinase [Pseudomonadota bacterium]
MLLAIDVGNTNLVLALGSVADGSGTSAGYRIETASVTDAGSCVSTIRQVLGDLAGEITDAVIASVVPAVTPVLAEAM